jgi:hypothetical protein
VKDLAHVFLICTIPFARADVISLLELEFLDGGDMGKLDS